METRKNAFLKLIVFSFVIITVSLCLSFLCSSQVKATSDTTKVELKQDGQNVKVSLNPEEGASIASFQIGLKIEADKASDIKNVTFNWANIENAKLKKESYDKAKGILNLYVVTDVEQNTGKAIDVGTIKIETNNNTKVSVTPIADSTTASSIAHNDTEVTASTAEKVTYIVSSNSGSSQGGNSQGGNSSSGNNNTSGNGSQGNNSQIGNNKPGSSSGNGTGSSSSNGNSNGSGTDNKDDDEKNENENKEDDNNVEDGNNIDNSLSDTDNSSNQMQNIATGTLPQTGEKDNFIVIWLFIALALLIGVLVVYVYKTKNKKNSWKI